ncbi:hypothetical protein [Asaia bogorensis]|uniref:hypothetical protein n=1 Tax=Asaia bogorensis TaxID=91915 RepID=UPI000EFD5CDB|nr:hypothetical protein [Asaia bogorensis]
MNDYLAYRTDGNVEPIMVKHGFHWSLLVFGPLALLASRRWIAFALTALISVVLLRYGGGAGLLLSWVFNLVLAVFGAEVIGWEARLKGYASNGLWMGRSADEARLRLMDKDRAAS